jgi:hypothetical protein
MTTSSCLVFISSVLFSHGLYDLQLGLAINITPRSNINVPSTRTTCRLDDSDRNEVNAHNTREPTI